MSAPHGLVVTETEVHAPLGMVGTEELEALKRWAKPFGIDPTRHARSRPLVRDTERRRIVYAFVDTELRGLVMNPDDLVEERFVQLEAVPPPWPPEIARHRQDVEAL